MRPDPTGNLNVPADAPAAPSRPRKSASRLHVVWPDFASVRQQGSAHLSRALIVPSIRLGAAFVLLFQTGYLFADVHIVPAAAHATVPFHLLNILLAAIFLRVTFSGWFREHWEAATWFGCCALMASSTAISLAGDQPDPLFVSVLLFLIGTGMLVPWSWRWQAALEAAGAACLAVAAVMIPINIYFWMMLATTIALAHCCHELARRNRSEIFASIARYEEIQVHLQDKISALERAERRARASEETLRTIIKTSPDSITVSRWSDGTFTQANPEFEFTGFTAKEVRGKSAYRAGLWAEKEQYKRYLGLLAEKRRVRNLEVSFRRKDGSIVPCLLSSVMVKLNGEDCVVSFSRDITRLKEAENKLRGSEAALRKIIETSPDPITIVRLSDGRYLSVNNAFVAATGYRPEEVIEKTPGELGTFANPEQGRAFIERLRAELLVRNVEVALRHRDGRIVPHSLSAVVTELGGEPCIVAISRDITEIKQVERELTAAREEALAAARAKSEFLSSMSHEIRTPMNAVLGMAELLADSQLTAEQRRWVEVMRSNGDALLDLINDILDLAKIESGRLTIERANFDFDELIDKLGDMIGIRAHEKGLELAVRIAPDVPRHLIGDPLRLRQILINLLGNAVKFTERGSIVLNVERADSVFADAQAAPIGLRFSVRDTGIGIPRDKLDVIFSSFAQADSSTTRRYGGSGLGLAIASRLVELYGGQIAVESEIGVGSCFSFVARFGAGRQPELPAEPPAAGVDLHGLEVMVVDDTEINRVIVREILQREGCRVREADSGVAALAQLDDARRGGRKFDLILLDCRMPGMDGIELARRVREFCVRNGAPMPIVMMLTSDDLTIKAAKLRELGLSAYLVKPIRRSELLEAIRKALGAGAPVAAATARPCETVCRGKLADLDVLLADDSPDNRLLVRSFLARTGCRLDEVEDGAQAVARFRTGTYDVVLMDMRMPVMDGLAATRAIRGWERENGLGRTPIIALTASALHEAVRECFEAGCDAHVSKPVRRVTLIEAIRAATGASPGRTGASETPAAH
jgi:PAS domain S-box-containing protein